jgi:putative tricarboxylic transport membrane protein
VNASPFDLFLLLALGALGILMRRYGLPVLPAIIGIILGPFSEENLRKSLQISNGRLEGLVTTFSVVVYVIVALLLLWPLIRKLLPRRSHETVLAEAAHAIEESHHQHGLTDSVSVESERRPRGGQ